MGDKRTEGGEGKICCLRFRRSFVPAALCIHTLWNMLQEEDPASVSPLPSPSPLPSSEPSSVSISQLEFEDVEAPEGTYIYEENLCGTCNAKKVVLFLEIYFTFS
jgi:hypothetical protein